jgi:hypothetical protein
MRQTLVVTFFEILTVAILLTASVAGQPCADTIYMGDTTVVNRMVVRYPVVLGNPCPIGGFNMVIHAAFPDPVYFEKSDTVGCRLGYHMEYDTTIILDSLGQDTLEIIVDTTEHLPWEYFYCAPSDSFPDSIYAVGLARSNGIPPHPVALDSGRGPIFYMTFRIPSDFDTDTLVNFYMPLSIEQLFVSDSFGFTNVSYFYSGSVQMTIDPSLVIRGDANCNGERRGSDVTYLVGFFKGLSAGPCIVRAGDANCDGFVSGGDVTFLVRYFKGVGPEPCP